MTCKKEGNYDLDMYDCFCSKEQYDKLKPLELNINGKWMKLPVEAWMSFNPNKKKVSEEEEGPSPPQCQILLHPYDISMTATYKWVIGLQFLQNFYSIFDVKNKKVGLIEVKNI